MKSHLIRGVGLALALTLLPVLVGAQKRSPIEDPPATPNSCRANGVRCLFGRAGGCSVTCAPEKDAVCIGAYCGALGFPHPARCRCVSANPT